MSLLERRPRIADVAARAGVSTATVDRVLNGRGGVRQGTAARVEEAVRAIADGSRRPAPKARGPRFDVVLAGDGSLVTKGLGDALIGEGERLGATVHIAYVERMNPAALADRLRLCAARGSSGVAVQVLDHSLVREALDELGRAEIPVVTVLTDLAGSNRLAYVGLDNRAAGRTAGFLMGRFCHAQGKLAIVWGGELYRSHEERESGFRNVLRAERPDLQCLEVITGNDDPAVAHARVREALAAHPDLAGLYCVGGGITGVADAIEEAGLARRLVMIGHNCNAQTRPYLLSGMIDALVHQDIPRIAQTAMKALVEGKAPPIDSGIPIDIITRENLVCR